MKTSPSARCPPSHVPVDTFIQTVLRASRFRWNFDPSKRSCEKIIREPLLEARTLKSDALLLLTAAIWGFAFVAQRLGMDHLGPFTFNGIRFALGCLSLLPLLAFSRKHVAVAERLVPRPRTSKTLLGGALAGFALYMGASLQQAGLVYTTAGKAGFITGLYVVIVPLLGLFWKQRPDAGTWTGALLAAAGLYFLSVTEELTIALGDFLNLLGAFFWAIHVLLIGWLSPKIDSIKLAFIQFAFCSLLSLSTAVFVEAFSWQDIRQTAIPLLYGGVCSVGVAYTLQVVAQQHAPPAHAAILLSLESAFAALGGWLLLQETLGGRGLFGCALMLAGMLLSQLRIFGRSS